jgi:dTDP-4-amino-4,6-dideoxygalactose transaminase
MGGEEEAFIRMAFKSNYIAPLGPMVDAFEREFTEKVGISHAVALSSGTAAIHMALDILGVRPGDEVFASTLTFIGSVTPITFQGAIPVFIDADKATWDMDPDLLEEELDACKKRGKLPKAVVPTDLYGQCVDYGRILDICEHYDVPVVADAAEALGATYGSREKAVGSKQTAEGSKQEGVSSKQEGEDRSQRSEVRGQRSGDSRQEGVSSKQMHAGKGAKAAVFSFNGNKIITTSGGGMLASDDEALIEKARFLSQQARDPAPHYEHSRIGYNYRMSNVLAAIGRGQLRALDDRVDRKREIFDYYQKELENLPGIKFMPEAPYGRCNRWLTVILITPEKFGANREEVRLSLEGKNIESRPVWKPMHVQPVFQTQRAKRIEHSVKNTYKARFVSGEVSEDLFRRGLCLPSGTAMTEEDMERVVSVIRRCRR